MRHEGREPLLDKAARNPSLLSGVLGTGLPGLGTEHLPGALCQSNEEIRDVASWMVPRPERPRFPALLLIDRKSVV